MCFVKALISSKGVYAFQLFIELVIDIKKICAFHQNMSDSVRVVTSMAKALVVPVQQVTTITDVIFLSVSLLLLESMVCILTCAVLLSLTGDTIVL